MATVKGDWNHVAMDPGSGLIIQKTETLVEKNVTSDLPGGGWGGRGGGVAGVAGVGGAGGAGRSGPGAAGVARGARGCCPS